MKILITGAKSQLAKEIIKLTGNNNLNLHEFTKEEMNVTNYDEVNQIINNIQPNIVIHCAANANVDFLTKYPDQAYHLNTLGTRNVAVASEKVNAKFLFLSTAYVFDGLHPSYTEFDEPSPVNIYGKTKAAAEKIVQTLHSRYFIIRTSWLCGERFIKWMQDTILKKNSINIETDLFGSPTPTSDLAQFIIKIIMTDLYGIYHVTSSGICSKYDYFQLVLDSLGISDYHLVPIKVNDSEPNSLRPKYSTLENMALKVQGFDELRPWNEGVYEYIQNLYNL
ncbi:SDR family oxidoreductase [Chengkuizengella sp. SCS-71B]|uniref:SDR family oxidoreductase n=1 Tax=Chengkuizengella sp. SCS-71B TaxID=3115290 RepID=UPI0032C23C2F